MMTDPIADMLTRIRNAGKARHRRVDLPVSKLKTEIARILKDEGFIADWRFIERGPQGVLRVTLKYGPRKEQILSGLRRASRPGLRMYATRAAIPRIRGGMGVAIITTSRGVMTDRQAREQRARHGVDRAQDIGPHREHGHYEEKRAGSEGRDRVDLAEIDAVEQPVQQFHRGARKRIPEQRAQDVADHDRKREYRAESPGIELDHVHLRWLTSMRHGCGAAGGTKCFTASPAIRRVHHLA